jgi:nitrogen regulatory protein PII
MKIAIGSETSAISNALENLALITTGTSAKVMGGAAATITSELKGAVEAAMATKLEIELKINEGKFNDIIDDVVGKYMDSTTGKTKIIAIARGI